ncbi:MAG: hypothetical protein ICV83_19980 [Cytophagales bacterium]|nr:hypothetical protein [Cytophagales bacterium]
MFSLRFTIVLLAILLVPFLLRHRYGSSMEPYPAILLPAVATKDKVAETEFNVRYKVLYGQLGDGTWRRVDERRLLYPIPVQYEGLILSREFGLKPPEPAGGAGIQNVLGRLGILRSKRLTEEEQAEAKRWVKEKLREQGFTRPVLKIAQREEVVAVPGGETLVAKNTDEKIIYLD